MARHDKDSTLPAAENHAATEIDHGIMPLIQAMWDRGIDTRSSSEGDWHPAPLDWGSDRSYAYVSMAGHVLPRFEIPRWMRVELFASVTVWRFVKQAIPDVTALVETHGVEHRREAT
jgi:hypothetical protein